MTHSPLCLQDPASQAQSWLRQPPCGGQACNTYRPTPTYGVIPTTRQQQALRHNTKGTHTHTSPTAHLTASCHGACVVPPSSSKPLTGSSTVQAGQNKHSAKPDFAAEQNLQSQFLTPPHMNPLAFLLSCLGAPVVCLQPL